MRETWPSIRPFHRRRQARIDDGRLADGDVLHLRFGDLQLRLQMGRLRHLAQRRAGGHLLAFFHRASAAREALAACRRSRPAPSTGPPGSSSARTRRATGPPSPCCAASCASSAVPIDGQAAAARCAVRSASCCALTAEILASTSGQQVFLGQRGVAIGLQLGRVVIGGHLRRGGLHVQEGLFKRDLEVVVIGLGRFQRVLARPAPPSPGRDWSGS